MIFIVIPVHNRKHFTRECLLSLRKQTFQNFKVIVVDDGSSDETSEMIQKKLKNGKKYVELFYAYVIA